MIDEARCRWVNVVGRSDFALERVRQRFALPARLVALTRSDHLHPTVIRIRPAWLVATCFTTPSTRHVFQRQPLVLWLTSDAVVSISPWTRRRGACDPPSVSDVARDALLPRILAAIVTSHEEVGRRLSDAFFGRAPSGDPVEWQRKEYRLGRFAELLEHQLWVVRTLGANQPGTEQVYQQLSGLCAIARYVGQALRGSGYRDGTDRAPGANGRGAR